jgi:adenylyl cyclase-associated protein
VDHCKSTSVTNFVNSTTKKINNLQENYDSQPSPVEINAERHHSILISRCKNTTIRINGKANAVSIDNSSKTSVILDSLVSSIDVIKCPNFALQVIETLPTVLLDQVDGATVYLSKDSLDAEVMTSKCSAVNVYLPPNEEDGDYRECSVPEQFRSYVKDGKLVTEIVEHKG